MADKPEIPTGPGGMSLRDWFAGQALAKLVADYHPDEAASLAYEYADAMMRVRGANSLAQPSQP